MENLENESFFAENVQKMSDFESDAEKIDMDEMISAQPKRQGTGGRPRNPDKKPRDPTVPIRRYRRNTLAKIPVDGNSKRGRPKNMNGLRRPVYECPACQKFYPSPGTLEDHMNVHTGAKPFECNVCQKSFSSRGSLWGHCRLHLDYYPFKCSLCDAKFRWKNCMYRHWGKHLRENPALIDQLDSLMDSIENVTFIPGYGESSNAKSKITRLEYKERILNSVMGSLKNGAKRKRQLPLKKAQKPKLEVSDFEESCEEEDEYEEEEDDL